MIRTCPELGERATEWDDLAYKSGSPFLTHCWLNAWLNAFGDGDPLWLLLDDEHGSLRAGVLLQRRRGKLTAAANVHSGDWGSVARDSQARVELWAAMADLGIDRIQLRAIPEDSEDTSSVSASLVEAGYRIATVAGPRSPWLELPSSWDDLLESVSGNLRSQVRRRRRKLDEAGSVEVRTASPSSFDADFDTFLRLEASGWKGEAGTAIRSNSATERVYREFGRAAIERGWMRLVLLELDGQAIAGDYGCAFAGRNAHMKTGFDEAYSHLSPGFVLRTEVLRCSIAEGLTHYDFLGEADRHKMSWTGITRPRVQIFAYKGIASPGYVYRRTLRPALKSARDASRSIRKRLASAE